MALKPTIYKAQIELADSDRNCFESLSLTLAKHPSETLERMVVRLLAYCLSCTRGLEFTKGISTADEPDLWVHSDSGEIQNWIEVGQPETPRLRKACGRARQVTRIRFRQKRANVVEVTLRYDQRPAAFTGVAVGLGRGAGRRQPH